MVDGFVALGSQKKNCAKSKFYVLINIYFRLNVTEVEGGKGMGEGDRDLQVKRGGGGWSGGFELYLKVGIKLEGGDQFEEGGAGGRRGEGAKGGGMSS